MKKNIAILGSTGSIGTQTLAIVRDNPEKFSITGLAAGTMSELFSSQVEEFAPHNVSLSKGSVDLANYDFEIERQDDLRKIRLLDGAYIEQFVEEFETLMGASIL